MNNIDLIIAYESGELDTKDTLTLFSQLIKTKRAWSLQGHYGRTASALISGGLIEPSGRLTAYARDLISS